MNIKYGEHRCIEPETTKAKFNNISDFEIYWLDKILQFIKRYPGIGTEEEAIVIANKTIKNIASEFKNGDEIIHFDDFGYAPKRCEREHVLIIRDGKVIKSELIRMS
jgi:hypothetical protein